MPEKKTTTTRSTTTKASTTRKTPVKAAAKPRTTAAKATTKAAAPAKTQVSANARHIDENTAEIKNNSKMIHLLYGTIIFLMLVIAGLAFYVGQMLGGNSTFGGNANTSTTNTNLPAVSAEDITVTVIDDSRCNDCETDAIAAQIKALPFLAGAEFVEKDFSDDEISKYLEDNNITALPAIIFNSNALNDGGTLVQYLSALPDGQYSLALGAKFDPFATRSENGFFIADTSIVEGIKADAHYNGNPDAKITWIEYTDVNCHYCKKMEQDGTAKSVMESIGSDLNKTSTNFIGVGGQATQTAAEVLECAASLGGSDVYNSLISEALSSGDNSRNTLTESAVNQGVDANALESCIDNGESKDIVERKFARGREAFGISGTPGNVIINNETGEYEVISGAYPATAFEEVINKMLGN